MPAEVEAGLILKCSFQAAQTQLYHLSAIQAPDLSVLMKITTKRDNLLKLTFPSHCMRCWAKPAKAHIQIIESNFVLRSLHQSFGLLSILLFLATGALTAGLGQFFEMSLMWTWLFAYIFILSLLKKWAEKSCRVIELPYCSPCLNQWERNTTMEYVLVFTFIFASAAAFSVGVHQAYPAIIPSLWAVSFVLYFFVKKYHKRYDPPLDLRQGPEDSVSLKFGNADFAKQTITMNEELNEDLR